MSQPFFYIILGILILDFLLERFLEWLNTTCWSDALPAELTCIYDDAQYHKSQQYLKHKQKYSLVVDTLTFLVMLTFFSLGGFTKVDELVRQWTENTILMSLLYFGILGFVSSIIAIPFDIYAVFILEEKFGFNTTTPKTFIMDKLKGWLLGLLFGGGILALIVWIYTVSGNWFWLLAWGVFALFMIFMILFYSNIIVPLFNRQVPLEPGPLRTVIETFADQVGFKLNNIFVIDGSKRSKKANAYFTGLGSKKRIVLYDTLINGHTKEELVAVLAHEIGHYKKKHTLQGLVISLLQAGLLLFILSLFIRPATPLAQQLCQSLGGFAAIPVKQSFHLGILAFGILYSPLSLVLGLIMNILSRKNEYEADRYAGEMAGPVPMMEALKKLSVNNLSNLRPHPAYVFFHYSHPTLLQRLNALEKLTL